MNQETPVEPDIFSKLLSIWIVIVVVVVATAVVAGGQVYWWQQAEAKKEKQALQEDIVNLQNEIKVLRANLASNQKNSPKIPAVTLRQRQKSVKTDKREKLLQVKLAGRERMAISLLKKGDLEQLAKYVHPVKQLRFSPFSFVDFQRDQAFSDKQLPDFLGSRKKYTWGYNEENGTPIRLTPGDYYKMFVYDQDYADTNEVSYNQNSSNEFTTSNCFEAYPQAIIVEYRITENNSQNNQNANWYSLRLVFEEQDQVWYLAGIIHDQWLL